MIDFAVIRNRFTGSFKKSNHLMMCSLHKKVGIFTLFDNGLWTFPTYPNMLCIKNFVTLYVLCFCQCCSCINIYTI